MKKIQQALRLKLDKLEKKAYWAKNRKVCMEFHINSDVRKEYDLNESLFSLTGNVVLVDLRKCRELTVKFNSKQDTAILAKELMPL